MAPLTYWQNQYHRMLDHIRTSQELKAWELTLLDELLKRAYPNIYEIDRAA